MSEDERDLLTVDPAAERRLRRAEAWLTVAVCLAVALFAAAISHTFYVWVWLLQLPCDWGLWPSQVGRLVCG